MPRFARVVIPRAPNKITRGGNGGAKIFFTLWSAKVRLSLRCLLFQAIFVMQSAENRGGSDSVTCGKLVPVAAVRNTRLDWLRNARA